MTNKELEALNAMSQTEEWGHKFTKYDIDLGLCSEEAVAAVKASGIAAEPKCFMTEEEMKACGVEDKAIIFDGDSHFAVELLEEMLNKCVKSAKHYLVCKHHCTWDGQSAYLFFDSMKDVAAEMAEIEGSVFFKKVYPKAKGMKMTVVSHETPNGYGLYIVALSEKEYKQYQSGVTYHDFKASLGIE